MKKQFCRLIFIIGTLFFTSCNKEELSSFPHNSVALYDCTAKPADEPYICFDSLITDSRCPKGAVCVWQGMALIKVSFHEKRNTHKFIMSLGASYLNYPTDTIIGGYKIIFTDLKPYPTLAIPASETTGIRASFSITR